MHNKLRTFYYDILLQIKELKQSLAWETDKEAFSRAVRENFGQFSEDRSRQLTKEQVRSPRLLVSEHGMNSKVRFCSDFKICHAVYFTSVRQSAPCDVFCRKIPT